MSPEEVARLFGAKAIPPQTQKKRTPEEWARLFGATLIGRVPRSAGSPLGAYHLAHRYRQRMTELRVQEVD
jgi:hypothetical protein